MEVSCSPYEKRIIIEEDEEKEDSPPSYIES